MASAALATILLGALTGVAAPQSTASMAQRTVAAMSFAGLPLTEEETQRFEAALSAPREETERLVEELLDPHCLFELEISPAGRLRVAPGAAAAELTAGGWRPFLVKVQNDAGITSRLSVDSPQAGAWAKATADENRERWLELSLFDRAPLTAQLTGLSLEYKLVSLLAVRAGTHEARFRFDAEQGPQGAGFEPELARTFRVRPATPVRLDIRDHDGSPTAARLIVSDERGWIHPYPNKRLGSDAYFHLQIYRESGDVLELPAGTYQVQYGRGPEYTTKTETFTVPETDPALGRGAERDFELVLELERWIDTAALGWFSGDHHLHGSGCLHYEEPTPGIGAEELFRHLRGEDLRVGFALVWGPGFADQRRYFTGREPTIARDGHVLRYDVEVSGFGAHKGGGHLALLGLDELDYPGSGGALEEWPSFCLPILRWARAQGALAGFAHSGKGLGVESPLLPNDLTPPMNGIGAMEFLVDAVHGAVDFLGVGNSDYTAELNLWYHALNCGFRVPIAGETDYPCLSDERVGKARSYVYLAPEDRELTDTRAWLRGLARGASYVSDGRTHLVDFRVSPAEDPGRDHPVGSLEPLELTHPGTVIVKLTAAALPAERAIARVLSEFWNLEYALAEDTVPIEVVVNGLPVAEVSIPATGAPVGVQLEIPIEAGSWIAARVRGAAHTNPIYCSVDGEALRTSRRSAVWCLEAVDKAWEEKHLLIEPRDRPDAQLAYEIAREHFRRVFEASPPEPIRRWPDPLYPYGFGTFPAQLETLRANLSVAPAAALAQAADIVGQLERAEAAGTLGAGAKVFLERRVYAVLDERVGSAEFDVPRFWQLGPFVDRPLGQPLPPDATLEPTASYTGLAGLTRSIVREETPLLLNDLVAAHGAPLTTYLAFDLDAPTAGLAEFNLGLDARRFSPTQRLRIWIGGELVYEKDERRPLSGELDRFHAALKKGRNRVVIRLSLQSERAEFALRVRGPDGLTVRTD